MTTAHQTGDVRGTARHLVERTRVAHQAGLSSLFVGDHHVTPTPYYQNTPMLGRMLAEWGNREAGALYLLPLWNPVLLAEQTATLACIAEGPFVMQCALGLDARQSRGMGVDPKLGPSMFEQSLEIVRALWAGEEVTAAGRFHVERARIAPLPPQPIEVWIGASADVALDRAARLGDVWLANPHSVLDQTKRELASYRQACGRHGKSPQRIAIRRDVYVGASAAEAEKTMTPFISDGYRGFDPSALIYGDVDEVTERLAVYRELGFTDVLMRNINQDPAAALGTIERMAQVAERLR